MERFDPLPYIQHSNRITDIFGYWPTFHDAWIQKLSLSVDGGEPWIPSSASPVLDLQVHVFEMTKDVTEEGYIVLAKHTLACLQFRNIESLQLSNFSYQNSIYELIFGIEPKIFLYGGGPAEGPPPNVITVNINSSCGLSGEFKCQEAEVMSAEPCDEYGNLPISPNPLSET